ncbi:hypothetical protein WIS52_20635 [Pseudonocardia nematodicida]|uniref:Uncharacterized protein n=1 Tax=Pseudonocardia nematodicida TaxID=1206997 RepID=A0ABV1KEI6_9PSEU
MAATAVLLLAGLVGAVLSVASRGQESWWWALLIGVPVVGLASLVVGAVAVVRRRRRRGPLMAYNSALMELPTPEQRRALMKRLRSCEPIPPEQQDLALRVAGEFAGRAWLLWLWPVPILFLGASVAYQDSWLMFLYSAVMGVVVIGFGVFGSWTVLRMRKRLPELEARLRGTGDLTGGARGV